MTRKRGAGAGAAGSATGGATSGATVADSEDRAKVRAAVAAVHKIVAENQKRELFSDAARIHLQFSVAKVPPVMNKIIKIPLPHSLRHENTDVCLFVKDLDRKNRDFDPTVRHFQDLLMKKKVDCVSEVIPLMMLKKEYKPFEAKRNLSERFDVFLADDKIARLLPTFLGKHFLGRKKHPAQVNMDATNLKHEIEKAVNNTRCILSGRGPCSMVTCAHSNMSEDQIVENVEATMTRLAAAVPGGAANLKTFSLKMDDSISIPIQISVKPPNEVELPMAESDESEPEAEDVTTVTSGKVKVLKDGRLILVKEDGREVDLTEFDEEEHSGKTTSFTKAAERRAGAARKRKRGAGRDAEAPRKKRKATKPPQVGKAKAVKAENGKTKPALGEKRQKMSRKAKPPAAGKKVTAAGKKVTSEGKKVTAAGKKAAPAAGRKAPAALKAKPAAVRVRAPRPTARGLKSRHNKRTR